MLGCGFQTGAVRVECTRVFKSNAGFSSICMSCQRKQTKRNTFTSSETCLFPCLSPLFEPHSAATVHGLSERIQHTFAGFKSCDVGHTPADWASILSDFHFDVDLGYNLGCVVKAIFRLFDLSMTTHRGGLSCRKKSDITCFL